MAGVLVALVATGAAQSPVHAIEPRAVAPFQVQAPDGSNVGSAQVALSGRQVLIYVDADCETCPLVFGALDGLDPLEKNALTFIVRGDGAAAARLMSKLPAGLAAARWFADSERSAYTAMNLQTAPTVLGLWSGSIHWARPGAITDPAAVRSAVKSWLGPEAPPRRQQQ
jgi:hypothetical protein